MFYINSDGFNVFTTEYLKKRGTCCRSSCLHCPYGFTVKKYGIHFISISSLDDQLLQEISTGWDSKKIDWSKYPLGNIKLIKLKDAIIGALIKDHISIKHLFLKTEFQSQGLSKELIEAYLF